MNETKACPTCQYDNPAGKTGVFKGTAWLGCNHPDVVELVALGCKYWKPKKVIPMEPAVVTENLQIQQGLPNG